MTSSYAVRTYGDRKPAIVRAGDDGFKVFDRPDLARLLVAPEPDGGPEPARAQAHAAAARFLADGKRGTCRLSDGSTAVRPFVEVIYRCEKVRPSAPSAGAAHSAAISASTGSAGTGTAGTGSVARSAPPAAAARTQAGSPASAPSGRAAPPGDAFTLRMNRL